MNYEKSAFLAGIAVGRRLKGWATRELWRLQNESWAVEMVRAAAVWLHDGALTAAENLGEASLTADAEAFIGRPIYAEAEVPGAYPGGETMAAELTETEDAAAMDAVPETGGPAGAAMAAEAEIYINDTEGE